MLKKLLFTVSIFTLFLLVSCKNIVNSSVEKASFSFSLGNEKSARAITGANNKDELKIDYSLIRNNKESVKQSEIVLVSDLYIKKFNFQEVPFGNNYKVSFNIYKDDILIYKAMSEPVNIDEIHIEAVLDMELQPCASEIKYELNGGAFTGVKPDTYFMDSLFIMPEPKKEGCRFAGWYKTEDFTGNKIIKLGKDNFFGNVTLYAKWEDLDNTSGITCDLEKYKSVDCGDTIYLSCNDYDEIRYTVDGSEPSKNSSLYNGIFVDRNHVTSDNKFVVKAVAYKDGLKPSAVFYKEFEVKTYTVTFDTSKETNITAPTKITGLKKGDTLQLESVECPGYTFDGWYTKDNKYFTSTTPITRDEELTAQWKQWDNVSNVVISTKNAESTYVDYKETVSLSCRTEGAAIYYTTDGSNPTNKINVYKDPIEITKDNETIKAFAVKDGMLDSDVVSKKYNIKKYTVTFDTSSETNITAPTKITGLKKGDVLTEEQLEDKNITKQNYEFLGWQYNNVDVKAGYVIENNITVTPKWRGYDSVASVAFNKNGSIDSGETIELSCQTSGATIYYTTDGSKPTNTSNKYNANAPIKIIDATRIRAVAEKEGMRTSEITEASYKIKTYKVTFKDDEHGKAPMEIGKLKKGDTLQLKSVECPGYTFDGWYTFDNKKFTSSTSITDNITLKAKWTPVTYNINYSLDGGTNSPNNPPTYTINSEIISFEAPSRDGYIFNGWYSDSTKGDEIKIIQKGSTGSMTLYAKWTPITYTVKFDRNGGDSGVAEMSSQTLTYDKTSDILTANTYTKTGYTFAGWNISKYGYNTTWKDAHTGTALNLSTTDNATVTLYAQWKPITYIIRFNKNDSSAEGSMQDQTITYDEYKKLSPCSFTKIGHTFARWYRNTDFIGESYTDKYGTYNDFTSTQGEVINLYAKWEISKHKITYVTGCDRSIETKTVNYDSALTSSDLPSLTKTDCIFQGWYLGKDEVKEGYKVVNDITIVANWNLDKEFTLQDSPKIVRSEGNYDFIEFGYWPQSIKPLYVTIDETKTNTYNGWTCYKGSDGFYYVKTTMVPYTPDSGQDPGDGTSGKYLYKEYFSDGATKVNYTDNYYFRLEPIEWRSVKPSPESNTTNARHLICNKALMTGQFNDGNSNNNVYENSKIRPKIKEDVAKAFSETAKRKLEDNTECFNDKIAIPKNDNNPSNPEITDYGYAMGIRWKWIMTRTKFNESDCIYVDGSCGSNQAANSRNGIICPEIIISIN